MKEQKVLWRELVGKYDDPSSVDYLREIRKYLEEDRRKIVILDDDPTGTQTVQGVSVLTEWTLEVLIEEFQQEEAAFYILTNTRAYSEEEARRINWEIGIRLQEAKRITGKDFTIISRGDSTLRGHFPLELEVIEEATGIQCDGWLLYPYFLEGKRYSVADIHYVEEGEVWVPVGQTSFAADSTFGFKASNLKEYVEEKTSGRYKKEAVLSISIEDIRQGGVARIKQQLASLENRQICIVNSLDMQDVRAVALAALQVEGEGKKLLYRTSSSFVQARLGQQARELLTGRELASPENTNGGLVFVGSYVPKTTVQLQYLIEHSDIIPLEVDVYKLLSKEEALQEISQVAAKADKLIAEGQDVVLFTKRDVVKSDDGEENLQMSIQISNGLMTIANMIKTTPRYLVSKGGITSSDMATKGLNAKKATVLGQILPGVPVWQLGPESRYPGMAFVIFPGNVGGEAALSTVIEKLR